MTEIKVNKETKLSRAVLENSFIKYGELMTLLKKKDVKVNGKRVSKDISVRMGDIVTLFDLPEKQLDLSEYFSPVYEDENIVLVDKNKGVNSDKLYEILKREKGELYYIHRLDVNTDGLIVFAKNEAAEKELSDGFKNHSFEKYYYALCYGAFAKKSGILEDYLIKDAEGSEVKIYKEKRPGAVKIVTGYEEVERGEKTSLLKVRLYTGKTHQIRAHLAFYGHFIVGDYKYGDGETNRSLNVKKQQLTSCSITFFFNGGTLSYLDKKTFSLSRRPEVI
ncbi:MAG TPA: RluA family pseudouridine synthase [Clostridiales bacterium]|nr:RluA family pseudouridine synthase [Clostridiales bacterium]